MILGITGGVGAGKTVVMNYLRERFDALLLETDAIGREVMEPGGACFNAVLSLFGQDFLLENGSLDRPKIAAVVFTDPSVRDALNAIVHPAVIRVCEERIGRAREEGRFVVLESAILIESGCGALCDAVWYIDAAEDVRRKRLKKNRGYSDERIDAMLRTQKKADWYRAHADAVIENNGDLAETERQIDRALEAYGRETGEEE